MLKPCVFAGDCKQKAKHAVFWRSMGVFGVINCANEENKCNMAKYIHKRKTHTINGFYKMHFFLNKSA